MRDSLDAALDRNPFYPPGVHQADLEERDTRRSHRRLPRQRFGKNRNRRASPIGSEPITLQILHLCTGVC